MEPITAIIAGILSAGSAVLGSFQQNQANRYGRLPDWLSPREFQRRDYTIEIIIGAMALIIIVIVAITAWKAKR